ncbi:serine/threonine-protein kinase RIO1-like [Diaphorina citri]|uniref:Serine/threonine-protein kinase RIO1 n=1 Tax=Diaphorina citri TaxID=121845 RepID=A0A3Q0J5K8_DIACI|nr:serine/threonine-protein kinase RIO1-like [Diaphorina citri]
MVYFSVFEAYASSDEDEENVGLNDDIEGEDSYEYSDDDDDEFYQSSGPGTNKQNVQVCKNKSAQNNTQLKSGDKVSNYQPNEKVLKKFLNKINDKYEGPSSLPLHAKNALIECNKKVDMDRIKTKDKHDRATAEQVMDPRTRMILFKLISRGMVSEVNGCISTGKEANVYHASPGANYKIENLELEKEFAIKIFKTSILVFKDRDKYVNGEFRFRHGYCKKNPRKMVRTWAEKEMRNLTRMYSEGLNVPKPILLKSHVLLMTFIGEDGWPAAKLKDTPLTESGACKLYRECVVMMWRLYNKCHLVHADLSEYNMLVHKATLFIIDVAQSVEHDHPHALQFLRKDCDNVTGKYLSEFEQDSKLNRPDQSYTNYTMLSTTRTVDDMLAGLSVEQFEPYCDSEEDSINTPRDSKNKEVLAQHRPNIQSIKNTDIKANKNDTAPLKTGKIIWNKFIIETGKTESNPVSDDDEKIFKKWDSDYVTSSDEDEENVVDFERDINLIKSGQGSSNTLIYQNIVGLNADLSGPKLIPELLAQDKDDEETGESSEGDSDSGSEEERGSKFVNSARPRDETAESKKVRISPHSEDSGFDSKN